MSLAFLERKDFWAGLSLIVTGAGAIFIARNYQFGSSLRMGPGYFPVVLGGMLILFGLVISAKGLRSDAEKIDGSLSLRALIVLPLALILFGLLIDRAGFVPAMLALVVASSFASTQFRLLETLVFAVFMTALCVAVFVWALGLPYELIVGFW